MSTLLSALITIAFGGVVLFIIALYDKAKLKKANPEAYIMKKVQDLFDEFCLYNKVTNLKLITQLKINTKNVIQYNLNNAYSNNLDFFKSYFANVDIDKWLYIKTYEIVAKYYNNPNYDESERKQYTEILNYLMNKAKITQYTTYPCNEQLNSTNIIIDIYNTNIN